MLLRQLVPGVVLCFFVASKMVNREVLSTIFVLVFSLVLMASFPKPHVALLWIIFCLIVYSYGYHVFGDHIFAACYAVLSAHFGGWLYEIPFFHPSTMFYSFRYPWMVNTQIVSGLLCVWLLVKRKIEANKTMLYSVIIYFLVMLFWVSGYSIYFSLRLWWLPRVGVMIPLWATLTGILGEKRK